MNVLQKGSLKLAIRRFRLSSSHGGYGGRSDRNKSRHPSIFLPGAPIPETGIYEVIHDRGHRMAHEAVLHGGEPFPLCDQCGEHVRFRSVRTAPYIFDDEDFIPES